MSGFFSVLKNSFSVFLENPKFIIPKLLIALLNSVIIIQTAGILDEAVSYPSLELVGNALILLVAVLIINLLDIFISSMYPFMAKDALAKKKVNLTKSFKEAISSAKTAMPPVLAVYFLFLLVIFLLSFPLAFLIASENDYSLIFSLVYLVVILAIVFFFYQLYPVAVFEKKPFFASLKRSVELSLKHKSDVAKATAVSFLLSVLSFVIAFAIEFFPQEEGTALFWFAFFIVRLLTAYVYSYLYVLSPVVYFDFVNSPKNTKKA